MEDPLIGNRGNLENSGNNYYYQDNYRQTLPSLEVKPSTPTRMPVCNIDYTKIENGSIFLITVGILYLILTLAWTFLDNNDYYSDYHPFAILSAMFVIAGLIGIMKSERKALIVSLVIQIVLIVYHLFITGLLFYASYSYQKRKKVLLVLAFVITYGSLAVGQILVWLKYLKAVRSFS